MPTYTAPTTRTTGELISAAIFNTDLVENIKYFKDSPAFAGNVTVAGTLGVTGATTLSSTLGVTGLITSTGGITGGASSHTTGAFSSTVTGGTYNGQTISSAASLTGTVAVAGVTTTAGLQVNTPSSASAGRFVGRSAGAEDNVFYFFNNNNSTGQGIFSSSTAGFELDSYLAGGTSIKASHASGAIRFYSGGTTERGGFFADGQFYVSLSGTAAAAFWQTSTTNVSTVHVRSTRASGATSATQIKFINADNFEVGAINSTGTATAYVTSSDQRKKNDLGLATNLDGLRALRVHDYTWKDDPTHVLDRNVFAQEAYLAIGRGVTAGDDDPTTITKTWMVEKAAYVPDLIVGWQQHDATIQKLAARIAALETKDN